MAGCSEISIDLFRNVTSISADGFFHYSLTQDGRSYSLSTAAYVNKVYEGNLSEFRSQESIIPMGVLKEDPFRNSHTNQQFEADEANHNGGTVYERELRTFLGNTNKIRAKEPADTGEYLEPEHTFHTPKKPEHVTTAQVVYEDVSYFLRLCCSPSCYWHSIV